MIFGEGPIIKNIAGDLNKLFLQGTRAGQPINNVEGDAAADQATLQLMADRDPVIRDISTGLGYATREVTVSGTGALQLVNSLGRPLKSWSVELAAYQEGSGDPSPENIRPIHGTNKITINTSGKNLLDINGYLERTGAIYTLDGDVYTITIVGNMYTMQYVFSDTDVRATISLGMYDNATASNCRIDLIKANGTIATAIYAASGQLSMSANFSRIRFNWTQPGTFKLSKPMIEFGSIATQYVPFIALNKTEITLPQTVYTGTVGSDGGESRWGEVDLGTLTWMYFNIEGHRRFAATLYSKPNSINLLCSSYKTVTYSDVFNNTDVGIAIHTDGTQVVIYDPSYTDVETFKAAMSGVQLVYELENPVQFAITTPAIPTTEGNGTIWITAEDGIVTSFSATYLQPE